MNMMTHKGYGCAVEFSSEDEAFIGRVIGIVDIVTFHGETVTELKKAFVEAVDFYLETCEARNEKPNKPFSGNLTLRIPSELHAQVAMLAESSHKSINQWATDVIKTAIPA
jgi:predicted HicB family RNase H-like nuclease